LLVGGGFMGCMLGSLISGKNLIILVIPAGAGTQQTFA
jgi:hypothetical protein